jgi:hypothetical protein
VIIKFSKPEMKLIYNILIRVKAKYNQSLDSNYNWIDTALLDSLINRFKFNLNDSQLKDLDNA